MKGHPMQTIEQQSREAAPRRLYCACCGAVTRGRQFPNQDTGYGLCARCADWISGHHNMPPDEMAHTYGVRGVHFDLKD